MPTLRIKGPDGREQEQELAESLTIGRSEGNDLVLAEGGVSRQHARFFVDDGAVMVEDIGSSNGTWVDGERIEGPTAVGAQSEVMIGDYEVALKALARQSPSKGPPRTSTRGAVPKKEPEGAKPRSTRVIPSVKGAPPSAPSKRPRPSGAASGPTLRGLTSTITGKSFALSGTVVVGRVAGNDIQVDDDSVSRRHAELEVNGGEVVLKDLGSANGTTVNGEAVTSEAVLADGDIVQFGVVELMFEAGARTGGPRRTGAIVRAQSGEVSDRPPTRDRLAKRPSAAEPAPKSKRLVIVAAVVAMVLVVGAVAKVVVGPPGPRPPPPGDARPKPPVKTQAERIEELLAECRSYSSSEMGRQPDWNRARDACDKVLELEPIQSEANQLLKKIQVERSCEDNLVKGNMAVGANRIEDAVEFFAKVRPECPTYFLRAIDAAKAPVAEAKKQAGDECKQYALGGKWEQALKRCEAYSRLACQTMKVDEIYPPPLMTMKLDGPLGKNDWRPKDLLYVNFLKARRQLKPNEPMWQCPDMPALRPPSAGPNPRDKLAEEFKQRFPDPEMGVALGFYFDGKLNDAARPLQIIRENVHKAAIHEQAKALQLDIGNVGNLYQSGTAELNNSRPDRAEEAFRKALEIDERLMLGDKKLTEAEKRKELDRHVSFVRKNIIDGMASACYNRGHEMADRKDFRAACRIWKIGFSFNKAHTDLLKAVQFCSNKADAAFNQANTCELYRVALDYAVDGDGYKEKVKDKMIELECQ